MKIKLFSYKLFFIKLCEIKKKYNGHIDQLIHKYFNYSN